MSPSTRRDFLRQMAAGSALLSLADLRALAAPVDKAAPWYKRTLRWGQTNLTELDPTRFDLAWWRDYWKRTAVQGVVVNAGGITAYYPTQVPLHRRAQF